MATVTVATCQFPVSADVKVNLGHVLRQARSAKRRSADVAHFPEGALSGYADSNSDTFGGFDWEGLRAATDRVLEVARELGMWLVLGSAHRLSQGHKPHNSLYIIDNTGEIVDRYDKRFCSGDPEGRSGELAHYSPGDHPSVWEINGVRCGALVCYEYRFPELYRDYAGKGSSSCSTPSTPPTPRSSGWRPSGRPSARSSGGSTRRRRSPIRGSPCLRR